MRRGPRKGRWRHRCWPTSTCTTSSTSGPQQWRRREATGKMIVVRYADDIVAGFEHEADARRFWDAMRARFEQFALELHGDKTRLLEFGRFAAPKSKAARAGQAGDLHLPGVHLHLRQVPARSLPAPAQDPGRPHEGDTQEIKAQLRKRMHDAIPEQGRWLQVGGARATSRTTRCPRTHGRLGAFRYHVTDLWRRTLRRRSQKDGMTWERMTRLAADWLPPPRILHPWPDQRFAVKHPR